MDNEVIDVDDDVGDAMDDGVNKPVERCRASK
jgi:hypothetical protein